MDHYEEIVGKVNVWGEGHMSCQAHRNHIRRQSLSKKTKAKPCTAVSGSSDGSVCARVVVADACTKCPFKSML